MSVGRTNNFFVTQKLEELIELSLRSTIAGIWFMSVGLCRLKRSHEYYASNFGNLPFYSNLNLSINDHIKHLYCSMQVYS